MAEIKGTDCQLYVGNTASAPSSYSVLEGQTDCTFDGSTNVADTTSKDNAGFQTGVSTTISGKINCSGNLRTSRANLTLLQTAWKNRTTHACKILFDATNGWLGDFYVTQFQISAATQDVVKYSIELTPAAALTQIP
jgi:predicted secreted protein